MPLSVVNNNDCLKYMKVVPNKYFDLAICDPPYGLDKKSLRGSGKLKNRILNKLNTDWDIAPPKEYFDELFRISKNQIIWGGNYFDLPSTRCFVIWDKMQYLTTFSAVEYAWTSFNKPAKLFRLNNRAEKIHPTQKPIELYAWLLNNFAKKGDKIFDSHVGSGSSRIAAYKLGFDFIGCEISQQYYDDVQIRFEKECLNTVSVG